MAVVTEEDRRSIRRQIAEARENLRLIKERQAQFVLSTNIPLQLVKEEHHLLDRIAELEQQLAESGVPGALGPRRGGIGSEPEPLPPFQAIADLPHFVGREQQLQSLKKALLEGQHVTLYSLEGMGGVGKTMLAAHIAYQLRPHFPDGVLWTRLDAVDTMSALSAFASAYGRDVSRYTDIESRSQVVREILANKRALVVLDNARRSEEVAPLLPPTGRCAVIITTRRHDLSATRNARRFHIGSFDRGEGEAFGLFVKILGQERAREEAGALMEIADLVGHLPLAVDIAASRLAHEPGWTVVGFLERIRYEKRRLDELEYEDLSVRASFNVSYNALTSDQQGFFAALGTIGGEDFSVEAVAYVANRPLEETHDVLRKLYGLSLVQQGRPERYRLHPLLLDYAIDKIVDTGVFGRMVEFFVRYAEAHETDYSALDSEASNILAALQVAYEREMCPALVRGVNAVAHFLEARGQYEIAKIHLSRAHKAASSLNNKAGLAMALLHLGRIAERHGDYTQAEQYFREGLVVARESGRQVVVSFLLANLGWLVMICGEYMQAEEYFQEGLSLAQRSGHRERISAQLANLGVVAHFRGNYARAEGLFQEGLAVAREIGHRERISDLLLNLGTLALCNKDYARAEELLQESLATAREMGHHENACHLLASLGEVAYDRGDYKRAAELCQEGLALARELGQCELVLKFVRRLGAIAESCRRYAWAEELYQEGLALARQMGRRPDIGSFLNHLGELHIKRRKLDAASEAFRGALEIAQETGDQDVIALALYGLARVMAIRGRIAEAQNYGEDSLVILESTSHLREGEVRRWLEMLSSSTLPGE